MLNKAIFKPLLLILFSFFIWLFFYLINPVTYLYQGSIYYAVTTLMLFLIFFSFGILSIKRKQIKILTIVPNKITEITKMLFFIGFFGVLLKIYVGFFVTKIFVAKNIFNSRLESIGQELTGGFIGIIGSILFPFSFIVLLIVIYHYKLFSKTFIFFTFLIGVYPFIEIYFKGGRTTMALLGPTIGFVIIVSFYKHLKLIKFTYFKNYLFSLPKVLLQKKVIVPLIIIIILFISYSVNIVNNRLVRFKYTNTFRVWEKKDYQWVKFDEDFKTKYWNSSKEKQRKMIGIQSLKHYFSHGVIEYIRLVNHLDKKTGYYYGQYEFNVFFKFFKAFGVPLKSYEELSVIIKRKAVYSTFFGPFYVDFGIFGVFIMFFWGRFVKKVFIHAKNGNTPYVIFYGYLATILVTSFFINFLLGSSSYYLFAFIVTIFIFKHWPNKFILKTRL